MKITVGKISDFAGDAPIVVTAPEGPVAVFKLKGKFYAVSSTCPHRGASLAEGSVGEDLHVTCPWHAWRFDLKTGACDLAGEAAIKTYEVYTERENVFLKIDA